MASPAHRDREELGDGEVGGAGRRRGEEEHQAPEDGLGLGGEQSGGECPPRAEQQQARRRVGQADHPPSPDAVEEMSEEEGPGEVPEREGKEVQPDAVGWYAVELSQDEAVGEEDGVVGEGLGDHQAQAEDRAPAMAPEEHPADGGVVEPRAGVERQPRRRGGERPVARRTPPARSPRPAARPPRAGRGAGASAGSPARCGGRGGWRCRAPRRGRSTPASRATAGARAGRGARSSTERRGPSRASRCR